MVALPYNFELHDIVLMALQHQTSDQMYRRVIDHFDVLYAESGRARENHGGGAASLSVGVPHRIGYVQKLFEEILSKPGVACWDGVKILDWYLSVRK